MLRAAPSGSLLRARVQAAQRMASVVCTSAQPQEWAGMQLVAPRTATTAATSREALQGACRPASLPQILACFKRPAAAAC